MPVASDLYLYRREGNYLPRVAAVHDLCGYGNCSLGVAIPVLSCAGIDVCSVPTSLFSAHTKFPGFYMLDTTPMLGAYLDAWRQHGVDLDGVYSGFLGSAEQVAAIRRLYDEYPHALRIVDPVMGDNGSRYPTYTDEMCEATRGLVEGADVLTPNLTEASILTGIPYEGADVDETYVRRMADALLADGSEVGGAQGHRARGRGGHPQLRSHGRRARVHERRASALHAPWHGRPVCQRPHRGHLLRQVASRRRLVCGCARERCYGSLMRPAGL